MVAPDFGKVIELKHHAPEHAARWTRVPDGDVIHTAFAGRVVPAGAQTLRHREGHPAEARLRATVFLVELHGRGLTLGEQRLVHRVLHPVLEIGHAVADDHRVRALMVAGAGMERRSVPSRQIYPAQEGLVPRAAPTSRERFPVVGVG